jgi:hypothetical protein
VGSDWIWELRVPVAAGPALREVYALAAERDLRPQRPDGLINLFSRPAAGLRTVEDHDTALAAMATGTEHGQFWTNGDTDIFVSWEDGRLVWRWTPASVIGARCRRRRPSASCTAA